jgi:hypothetical protein
MTAVIHGQGFFRVLAVFPHPRRSGHAVLDSEGLVPAATFGMDLRRVGPLSARAEAVTRRLTESVRAYRPDVIVIVRASRTATIAEMAAHVISTARAMPMRALVIEEHALQALFFDRSTTGFDQLGQCVALTFFPELVPGAITWGRGGDDKRRPRRPAWKAVAGALAALAEHDPHAVRRLARGRLPPELHSLVNRPPPTPYDPSTTRPSHPA